MARAKKFGTFSGVFTPSILTILGVIMYLRFPSIIGQAGLINTIGIIIIAHIISITTSLSVASLSTDKPVQNGGTYFMISRSLGLPIGGTLGIALFVGLSFSVSLYLIGFAESLLQYWDIDNTINYIRITGSIVLLAVTTITFISTSLAIKSQYFIMAAIGLSLLSIFFGHHSFTPTEINLQPLVTAAPFMVLFGIFFPAVTGFEAGVSMSGDLRDPKKSLPYGAMMAVGIGFVVYIGLALFFSFTVSSDALANDPQILFKISLVPALVIAGIWGATLSSAFGSILGAPRILQAIAMDKIAPKIFAKGAGKTNEPRNALLLAAFIAEAGILIGDLDVIARIVSMFFITTYAFLNLASVIESWSSSDFRPAFKIPKFVGILGTLSAFIVMILLDFIALLGAVIVLGLLYFYLRRKELILESGDAWSSFWTNLAKRSLLKLSIQKEIKRNWRPNIILFSGGEKARPHLVEMGLSLTGKLGALTDFELIEGKHDVITKLNEETVNNIKKTPNFFKRQYISDNIENGIKTVTSVYGFNGFEPNTILMGWSKNTKNIDFLVNVLIDFKRKKLNAVFLDYDKISGFGKKENIDIWWNGKGRMLSYSLSLLKFLLSDPAWRDAKVRILIINNNSSQTDKLYRHTSSILSERRINASIKVINDDFGDRSKEVIINNESKDADLVMLGMSHNISSYTRQYIESISHICELSASILFLTPSEEFEEINIIEKTEIQSSKIVKTSEINNLLPFPIVENIIVRQKLEKLDTELIEIENRYIEKSIVQSFDNLLHITNNLIEFSHQNLLSLRREISENEKDEIYKVIVRNHQSFLRNINGLIKDKNPKYINEIKIYQEEGISLFINDLNDYIKLQPDDFTVQYFKNTSNKESDYKVHFQKIISYYLKSELIPQQEIIFESLQSNSVFFFAELRKVLLAINDTYEKALILPTHESKLDYVKGLNFKNEFNDLEKVILKYKEDSKSFVINTGRKIVIGICEDLQSVESIKLCHKKVKGNHKNSYENLFELIENWGNGITLLNNTLYLDTQILSEQKIAQKIIQKSNERIKLHLTDEIYYPIERLIQKLNKSKDLKKHEDANVNFPDKFQIKRFFLDSINKIYDIIEELPEEILLPEKVYVDGSPLPLNNYTPILSNVKKVGISYFNTLFHEPTYREIESLELLVNNVLHKCHEILSIYLFSIENKQNEVKSELLPVIKDDELFKKLENQLNEQKAKIELVVVKSSINSIENMHNAFSKLFYHTLFDSEKNLTTHQREIKSKKINALFSNKMNLLKSRFSQLLIFILNSSSSGIILSKKYLVKKDISKTPVNRILDIIDEITPDTKTHENIPFIYRTLMSSRSKINDEFWIPKNEEVALIKDAIRRHKVGLGGAILIKGVHGAGKTTLSRYAVNHFFRKSKIIWINPPPSGSISEEKFLEALRISANIYLDYNGIFNSIPEESLIVINDLELWWERTNKGHFVIEKIIELINEYSKKHFFIINCNSHSFNIINKTLNIENSFISLVDCNTFNTKQLQQLILTRHKSSGISFSYMNKNEEDLSQLSLTALFNSYFTFSGGNPGVALNAWKANIIKSQSNTITIKKPSAPNIEILEYMDSEWIIVIALFIQHKVIDKNKLSRIANLNQIKSEKILSDLYNSGIIVLKEDNSYSLGRNIEPYMVKLCISKGLI